MPKQITISVQDASYEVKEITSCFRCPCFGQGGTCQLSRRRLDIDATNSQVGVMPWCQLQEIFTKPEVD